MNQPISTSDAKSRAGNKRTFNRIPVQLGAHIRIPAGKEFNCVIRDFSTGGMLLFLSGKDAPAQGVDTLLKPGTEITISCRVKQGTVLVLKFTGNIVRRLDNGFAVRLQNPELESLRLLHKVASIQEKRQRTVQAGDDAKRGKPTLAQNKALIDDCNQLVLQRLSPMMVHYMDKIIERMRDPGAFLNNPDLGIFFEAATKLSGNRDALVLDFVQAAEQRLRNYRADAPPMEDFSETENNNGTLSLIDDDHYEDWLAAVTTIDKIENKFSEVLYETRIRLSELHGLQIDPKNHPFRPSLFVDCFEQLFKPLGLSHRVNMLCNTLYREVLVAFCGEQYTCLNQFLVEKNILPKLVYKISKQAESNTATSEDEPADTKKPQHRPTAPDRSPPASANQSTEPANGVPTRAQSGKTQATAAADGKTGGTQRPVTHKEKAGASKSAGHGDSMNEPQSILDIVGSLSKLSNDLSGTRVHFRPQNNADAPQYAATQSTNPAQDKPDYSVQDVIHALNLVQHKLPATTPAVTASAALKQQLLDSLQQSAGKDKKLGQRELQIMDVADKVFKLMNADAQVSEQIRSWINRLELPILKIALKDEQLFLNREHEVRQVLNKIAQLEVLVGGTAKNSAQHSRAINAVEWIVDMVNNEHEATGDAFARAVRQLDILLQAQKAAYDGNLHQVKQDIASGKLLLIEPGASPYTQPWDLPAANQEEWLKKAARIREQDWIVMDAQTEQPARLRVGLVDRQAQQLALVNLLGQLNRGLTFTDMARQLHDGSALYLDSTEDPAMDRAQYSMLQELHEELLDQAKHDMLTGAYNRREFETRLSALLEQQEQKKIRFSVGFLDIDQFKLINNACGYEAGDELLRNTAAILSSDLPSTATVARLGNDEFGFIIPELPLEDVLDQCETLLKTVHERKFTFADKRFAIGLSAGLVNVRKPDETASTILQEAENSCNMAREAGGNRIIVYAAGGAGQTHKQDILKWGSELDHILEDNMLVLNCQRILPIRGGGLRKSKYEILLRVKNTKGENITEQFVEAAERFNRMSEVDRWVITNTFDWMTANPRKLDELEAIAINLSARSINDESFLAFIHSELARTQVAPAKVCFELTETTGITSLSSASEFMLTLKDSGCRFSLDGFGAGMSSYAYLRNLPVDYLKIDGAFVRDLLRNPSDQALVNSICEVGHFMNKKVIAEFVESDSVLKKLQDLRVDFAQGYGVEKPKPLASL